MPQRMGTYVVMGANKIGSIGWHIAKRLHERGSQVLGLDYTNPPVSDIPWMRRVVDARNAPQVKKVLEETLLHSRGISGFVYASGINHIMPVEDITENDFVEHMRVNVMGAIAMVQGILSLKARWDMPMHGVFIGSNTAFIPRTNSTMYAASKAALVQAVKTMHRELAPKGMRLMTLDPGPVRGTGMDKDVARKLLLDRGWDENQYYHEISGSVPIKAMMPPSEVAKWAVFLLDEGEWAGGTSIRVDGGQISGRG